ncbi:MAG: Phosphoesterase, PA-phosphatase related protein [Candidatus Saccharibacteria bacterium]|nr:Phosphoesterase, PA-phosphatase related protein [Candidatus Saccharibacteria bacterium]
MTEIIHVLIRLIADGGVVLVVLIGAWALIFKIPKGGRFEAYTRILMAGLTSYLIAKFIASIYQPNFERPFEILGVQPGALYLNNPGFPSDHALFVTAITAAVWFETKMKKTTLLLVVLTVLICVGRVLALVHTPLDVIGGVVIGLVGAVWYVNKARSKKRVGEKEVSHGTGNHHRSAGH